MDAHIYETRVEWNHDRKGTMSAKGIDEQFGVATPPQFPKGMEGIWSPEHLFAASVSSCLMTTFLAIAEYSRLEFSGFSCDAVCKLDKVDGKFMVSEVILEPSVTITQEKDRDKTLRILNKSEKACLISNSLVSKVTMERIDIQVADLEPRAV